MISAACLIIRVFGVEKWVGGVYRVNAACEDAFGGDAIVVVVLVRWWLTRSWWVVVGWTVCCVCVRVGWCVLRAVLGRPCQSAVLLRAVGSVCQVCLAVADFCERL